MSLIAEGPGLGIYMRSQIMVYRSQKPMVEQRVYEESELPLLRAYLLVEPSILFLCNEEPEVLDDDSVELSEDCYSRISGRLPPHYTYSRDDPGSRLRGIVGLLKRELDIYRLMGGKEAYYRRLRALAERVLEEARTLVDYGMLGEDMRELIEEAEGMLEDLPRAE